MANTLFAGNLPFQISDEALIAHFAAAGEVRGVTHVRQRDTGRSFGCAFVEMADAQSAEAAREALNGVELDGRELSVWIARP